MNQKSFLACAASALALLAACESSDPVSSAGSPSGTASVVTATPSAARLPGGAIVNSVSGAPADYPIVASTYAYGGFNPNAADAFNRKNANATLAQRGQYFVSAAAPGVDTLGYWRIPAEAARVGAGDRIDPRTPSLSATVLPQIVAPLVPLGAPATLSFFRPGAYAVGTGVNDYFRIRTALSGLTPGATYQLVLIQYRLTVNGELDQVDRILNGAVAEPDNLAVPPTSSAPNAPNTTPFDGTEEPTCAAGPSRTRNPYIVAEFTAALVGATEVDYCWRGGNFTFLGRSDDTPYDLPAYNYIEVWEGGYPADRIPTATNFPVLRIQAAQDVDAAGVPINNAYPPFPAPGMTTVANASGTPATAQNPYTSGATISYSVDRRAAFPLDTSTVTTTPDSLAFALTGGIRLPNQITGKVFNLDELGQNGVYKLWLINELGTVVKPATGTLTQATIVDDAPSYAAATTGAAEFKSGRDTLYFTLDPYATIDGTGTYADSLFFLLVTKESASGATTPSISQPMWVNIARIPGRGRFPAPGNLVFGSFNGKRSDVVRYVAQGSLIGGVLGDTNTFNDARIDVTLRGLMRPPKGYEYHGFLLQAEDAPVDLGVITGPGGESLADADVAAAGPNLTATGIVEARLEHRAGAAICNAETVGVYLYPKPEGSPDPRSSVFRFDIPEAVLLSGACNPPTAGR